MPMPFSDLGFFSNHGALANERKAAEELAKWKSQLKAPLIDFYQKLASRSSLLSSCSIEDQLIFRTIVSDTEALVGKLDSLFTSRPRNARPLPAPPAEVEPTPKVPGKVLVVDDDDETCRCLKELLEGEYEVLTARDGLEGHRLAREHVPDVVITDLCMPEADGFTLVSLLRRDLETEMVPVLVLSGVSDIEARIRLFEAGAFDYLAKPVVPREVMARVRNALTHMESLRRERTLQQTDDLTGLANRRRANLFLSSALMEASRAHSELTVVVADQNGLKSINDQHGHAAGDKAICAFARALQTCKRASDCAARVGGDEFVVVMPGADRAGAEVFIARVQQTLLSQPVQVDGTQMEVTACFGVASLSDMEWNEPANELLQRADKDLYRAKRLLKHQRS